MKVGLVLGAGGVVGAAYHAGALTALQHDLGWDPRTADVIVGTSAGSLVGALLRRNVAASDMAAWTVDAPLSPHGIALGIAFERPQFDAVSLRQFVKVPRLPHPAAMFAAMTHPHRIDPLRALLTHLPDGARTLTPHTEFLGADWPDAPLWLCAVRRRDGRRVVLVRNRTPDAGLGAAVAASCAVPGYFVPVSVDGVSYIDGGLKSPTNADVLHREDLDLVIVVAPMSAAVDVPRFGVDAAMRRRCDRQLRAEVARLRAGGTEVVTFAPGAEVLALMTTDFMSDERRHDIVAAAFMETGAQAQDPVRRAALEPLRGQSRVSA